MDNEIVRLVMHTSVWDVLTAIGTTGAAVVALGVAGKDTIARWLHHPVLDVEFAHTAPDCQIIGVVRQLVTADQQGRHVVVTETYKAFYCRIRVLNAGKRRAFGVSVRITRFASVGDDGVCVMGQNFIPMNLMWTNLDQALAPKGHVLPVLVPGLPQHCDFFKVEQPVPALLDLRTEVTPNEVGPGVWPTKKPPGHYRADIAVSAENAKTIRRTLEIEFSGTWSPDVNRMAKHEARAERSAVPTRRGGTTADTGFPTNSPRSHCDRTRPEDRHLRSSASCGTTSLLHTWHAAPMARGRSPVRHDLAKLCRLSHQISRGRLENTRQRSGS